jgi:hypothetical protein
MKYPSFIYIVLLVFTCSCVTTIPESKTYNYCYPDYSYTIDSLNIPYTSMPTIITSDSILKKKYSTSNINIANATGTLDFIFELVQLKKLYATKDTPETQISIMIKKQEIANRLIVCRTEIAGIAAELDFKGERVAQLSSYMSDKQLSKINKLTVASITVGALTAVVAVS